MQLHMYISNSTISLKLKERIAEKILSITIFTPQLI